MEEKKQMQTYDYAATGILGFSIGFVMYLVSFVMFALLSFPYIYGETNIWGWAVLADFISAIFGYLPGGFVAGYFLLRARDTEKPEIEGAKAGGVSYAIYFLVSLILSASLASRAGRDGGTIMGMWALGVFFALAFPLGGYFAGTTRRPRYIPTPAPAPPVVVPPQVPSQIPPPPPIAPKEDIVTEYSRTRQLLDSLNKRLAEGAISEETYRKLNAEFQMKLDKMREKIESEINNLRSEISQIENEKALKMRELEELKARQLIGQITVEEYERKKVTLEKEIQKIETRVSSKQEKIQKLQELAV